MRTKIHFLKDERIAASVEDEGFDAEKSLQTLIADHPALLAGDQMYAGSEVRFLLVDREVEIPSSSGNPSRWRLDHLFVDQNGTPTLVEIKRSRDRRLRREVVGQLLEYAANGLRAWPKGTLRKIFEKRHNAQGHIEEFLARDLEVRDSDTENPQETRASQIDAFWNSVDNSLSKGRIRLVFLADSLPRDLVRVIEFLNERFESIEVVGVEVRKFETQALHILVPRVMGLSTKAWEKRARSDSASIEWDEESFLDQFARNHGDVGRDSVERIMKWCEENGVDIGFTKSSNGSFVPEIPVGKRRVWPIAISVDGRIKLQLGHLANRGGGMETLDARETLIRRLNQFLEKPIGIDRASGTPSFEIREINSPSTHMRFLETLDWIKRSVQSGSASC